MTNPKIATSDSHSPEERSSKVQRWLAFSRVGPSLVGEDEPAHDGKYSGNWSQDSENVSLFGTKGQSLHFARIQLPYPANASCEKVMSDADPTSADPRRT